VTALELWAPRWPLVTDEGGGAVLGHRDPGCSRADGHPVVEVVDPYDAWPCPGCVRIDGGRLDPGSHAGQAAAHDVARTYRGERTFMLVMRDRARDPDWWPSVEQTRAILATRHLP
jgi:hypothetical protein